MDFSWSEEQLQLRKAVIDFARQALNGDFARREKIGEFSRDAWRECANFGVQGMPLPERFGGSGSRRAHHDAGDGSARLRLPRSGPAVLAPRPDVGDRDAAAEVRDRPHSSSGTCPGLCDGTLIGAHGISEPGSGSDAFSMRTRAERRGDRYVLNGSKTFVTNAPVADLFVLFATVDPRKGMWGVTGFLIEKGTKGLSVGPKLDKMGLTTSPTSEVFLEDCEVAAEQMIGKVGQGATIFNHAMAWERSCILASTVGAMEHELEVCLKHAKERTQFGKPIGNFQLVAAKLADMKVRLETCKLLLYRAAWAFGQGEPNGLEGAIAKLSISEAAVVSALDAIQIHGGYGYMREYQVERHLRDNVAARLYSGTSEIQRLIVARHLGLTP